MNKNVNSPKGINEYKIVVPMSNEAVNKIKSNITKSILGVSIAGVMIAGAATQVKAESVENPTAIVQEAKEEVRTQYDQEIASILKSNSSTEDEEVAELKSATVNLADETSEESESASEEEAITEDKGDISLKDFIADDSLNKFFDFDKIEKEEEKLEISEENPAEAQKAEAGEQKEDKNLQKADDLNYANDEKNVGDYRQSDLQPGNVNQELLSSDEKQVKDGFKFEFENPSEDSPSKTEYGYQITIDKKTGQRTYTKITVTDGGRVPAPTGEKPMMGQGEKLTTESPDVTYQPTENSTMDSAGVQRNLNYVASEDTLKHINNKDNPSTSFGMKDDYTTENPRVKFFGDNFSLGYKVNPWPNENDSLKLMKLNGEYKEKVFVQGQDINTGIKVDNIDDNAKERLVGQVYNPNTGEVVPGASAYIGNDGNIHIKMPEGALKKDENGKTVINEDSIFNTPDYKALQNLDVKFFARPRTAEEFKNIAETPDDFGETGTYTGSGAGTGVVNHKGTDVAIDKQGIDRYDHYNLIGNFKLNLDDTRYYDQSFIDGNNEDTRKDTSSAVKPGEPFEVKIYEPENPGDIDKSADEMNDAENKGEAAGKVILDFINRENQGKEDKDQWKVTLTDGDISKFTITPPKSAQAGDFVAVPVEYTYTNGSKDVHWFHFVVQESDNYRPEYHAKIGYKGDSLTNTPEDVPEDTQKNKPESYELVPGTYKDSAGNVWDDIKVDPTTGVVTAVVPESADIKGGENLFVDVKVNYTDQKTGEKKEETIKAQFIARPKYKEEVTKEFESDIPFETKFVYDDTLEAGKVIKTEGVVGKTKTTFKQVVINGEKGIINEAGEFVKGEEAVVVTTEKEKQDAVIRIGTKPATTTVEIPRGLEYELDYTRKDGDPEVVEEGNDGLVTITTTRDPNTGEIKVTKTVTTEAKNKKIKIPAMTEGTVVDTDEIPFGFTVEFDPDFYTNHPDVKDNYKIVKDGVAGTNKKTWTIKNSQIVGDYKLEKTDPVNAVIKVGQKDYTGTVNNTVTKEVPYTVKVVENPDLEAGKTNVKQEGKAGSKTYEYFGEIVNGQLKDGTNFTEKELTDKYVEPTEHIIEIGTKPVENEKSAESEVGVDVEWVFDENKGLGTIEVSDLTPGKVTTRTKNKYNPETGQIETIQETVVEKGKRKVIVGMQNYNGEFEEVKNNIIPYETEIVFDSTLKAGEKVIDQAGENGETVTKTKRNIVNGKVVSSEEPVVEKTKEAVKQIIRVGSKTEGDHSYTEKLPFETKVEVNQDLKKGEWRYKTVNGEEQKGKLGSRTTEWTIVNSEVQKVLKVTEEKPVDAIIEVGSADFTGEVKHKETFEVPFEVEVRYNKDLPAGTRNEIQKGVKGSYDVEYKQAIKNGEADGEMTKTEANRVEAKKHIIEVGTKVETPENNYSKDVEVEIEYVYDDTKDKGVVETGKLTKGKVETKVVDKYNPETGKVEQTTEEVVTKAKQKVIVGTKDFTGTYEYRKTCPIPFEVEIIEDDTLSKGEKVVKQQGQPGSKTTSYEQDIKNGQPEGEARKTSEEVTEQPTKHIVRVGTKPLEGNRENVVDKAIPYETEVIYDSKLEAGTRIVDNEGKDGKERVTTTITSKDGNIEYNSEGKVIEEKEDRIVRIGVKPVVKETELGNNTEYRHNPELKEGETKIIEEGSKGSVKYTTTFNKETGKLEVTEERTEPKNKVVEYGSKTDGEFTYESEKAYDIIIRENPDLEAGKTNVIQEGKPGKTETTVKIENSKEVDRTTKTITEKQDKIIEVGTKNVCPVPGEDPKNPETPGDDKPYEPGTPGGGEEDPGDKPGSEDPGKPGEDKPNKPGTPGEENPSDPGTEEPGKPGEENPSEPGTEEPGKPGEENPSEPGTPGSEEPGENIENPEEKTEIEGEDNTGKNTNPNEINESVSTGAKTLPKTGDGVNVSLYGYLMGVLGSGFLGLGALKKKKDEEDEEN